MKKPKTQPETPTRKPKIKPLWIILGVALLVRMIYFWQYSHAPFAKVPFLDSALYNRWADQIAAGDLLGGRTPFFIEPGYAYLLAFVKLLGGQMAAMRFVQLILGTGIVGLTYFITRRLSDETNEKPALIAGLLTALYVPLIYFEGLLLKTVVEIFSAILLLFLFMIFIDRPRSRLWIGLGVLGALSTLIRSVNFIVLVLGAGWTCWVLWLRMQARPWMPAFLMTLGVIPVFFLIALRNHSVSKEWLIFPTNSGINFYIGNHLHSDGADASYPFGRNNPFDQEEDTKLEAERRAGHPLSHAEVSSFWWQETFREIRLDPGRWVRLIFNKILLNINSYESTDNESIYFVRKWVPILRWPLPGFWLAFPLGLAGLLAALRRREPQGLLLSGFIILQMSSLVVFKVAERYRLITVPLLIGLGCVAFFEARKAPRKMMLFIGSAVSGFLLVSLPNPAFPNGQDLSNHTTMLGIVAATGGGKGEGAIETFEKATQLSPGASENFYNLGLALFEIRKDPVKSEEAIRKALELDSRNSDAYHVLGRILMSTNRDEEALKAFLKSSETGTHPAAGWISAASVLGKLGRLSEAKEYVDKGLRLKPDDSGGWETSGNIRYAGGDSEGAAKDWEQSLKFKPDNPGLRQNLEAIRGAKRQNQ